MKSSSLHLMLFLPVFCGMTACTTVYYASDHQSGKRGKGAQRVAEVSREARPASEAADEAPFFKGALTLDACIDQALDLSRKRPASQAAVVMAEAKHHQALASYWPQVSFQASSQLRSTDPNYIFPSMDLNLPTTAIAMPGRVMALPASTVTTQPSVMSLPLGPNGAMVAVPVAAQTIGVPSQSISVPARTFTVPSQSFHVPERTVKVMDRQMSTAKVEMKWLLWNRGRRAALTDQAEAGVEVAQEEVRRTDLELVYDVRRMYAAAALARNLEKVGRDTLSRLDVTLELTENLYQGGSMTVTKNDYLKNAVIVEGLRSMVDQLVENRQLAESALANSMGLDWNSEVKPSQIGLTFRPLGQKAESLIADAYQFNPDWKKLESGLKAAEAKIREEKAGLAPRVALMGNIHGAETPFRGGQSTDENLNAWNVGVAVEMPLFDGYLTKARIDEAKARLEQLKQQKLLLHEGMALQVKAFLIQLSSMEKQDRNNRAARTSATENRELSEKAYRNDLLEADDVFEAQIMEAQTEARYLKLRFDHQVTQAKLEFLIGKNFKDRIQSIPPDPLPDI